MTSLTLTAEQERYLADIATIYNQPPEELLEDFFEQYLRDKAETITDTLGNFAADLMTESAFRPFLVRLLSLPAGGWHSLYTLCADLPAFEARVQQDVIPLKIVEDLNVMWLPNPWEHSDMVLVLFFCNTLFWHSLALVNKGYILEI